MLLYILIREIVRFLLLCIWFDLGESLVEFLPLFSVYWRQELLDDSVLPILNSAVAFLLLLLVVFVVDVEARVVVEVSEFHVIELFCEELFPTLVLTSPEGPIHYSLLRENCLRLRVVLRSGVHDGLNPAFGLGIDPFLAVSYTHLTLPTNREV